MRFLRSSQAIQLGLAVADGDRFFGVVQSDDHYPSDLNALVAAGGSALKSVAACSTRCSS